MSVSLHLGIFTIHGSSSRVSKAAIARNHADCDAAVAKIDATQAKLDAWCLTRTGTAADVADHARTQAAIDKARKDVAAKRY